MTLDNNYKVINSNKMYFNLYNNKIEKMKNKQKLNNKKYKMIREE